MKFLVFNIGCIECGVSSNIVGVFESKADAEAVCNKLLKKLHWREKGENDFQVYDLKEGNFINIEYQEALK